VVLLLAVAGVINYLDRAAISVALPQVSAELALGPVAKGVLLSAFFWSYTLLQVPAGMACDWWSVRWVFAAGFAVWSIACGFTGIAAGLGFLILLRLLLGVGESVLQPGLLKFVSALFAPRDRGLPTSLVSSGTRIGLAAGAPLVAWLTVRFGWRSMFYLIGFFGLVWLVPWFLAVPDRLVPPAGRQRTRLLKVDRNLVGCCLGYFSFGYYQYILVTWLPDYFVTVRHFSVMDAGVYSSVSYLVWGVCTVAGGWITDILSRRGWNDMRVRKGAITVAYMAGIVLIPASLVHSPRAAVPLVAVASLVGLSAGNILVLIQDCAPAEQLGAWSGVTNFIGNIGGVLSPMITGLLISSTGSYVPAFALAAGILLAGILPFWFMVGPEGDKSAG
jgi:MFS family permease